MIFSATLVLHVVRTTFCFVLLTKLFYFSSQGIPDCFHVVIGTTVPNFVSQLSKSIPVKSKFLSTTVGFPEVSIFCFALFQTCTATTTNTSSCACVLRLIVWSFQHVCYQINYRTYLADSWPDHNLCIHIGEACSCRHECVPTAFSTRRQPLSLPWISSAWKIPK